METEDIRMEAPVFIISLTASVAFRTSGNWTTATVVGSRGAKRRVANRSHIYEYAMLQISL